MVSTMNVGERREGADKISISKRTTSLQHHHLLQCPTPSGQLIPVPTLNSFTAPAFIALYFNFLFAFHTFRY